MYGLTEDRRARLCSPSPKTHGECNGQALVAHGRTNDRRRSLRAFSNHGDSERVGQDFPQGCVPLADKIFPENSRVQGPSLPRIRRAGLECRDHGLPRSCR